MYENDSNYRSQDQNSIVKNGHIASKNSNRGLWCSPTTTLVKCYLQVRWLKTGKLITEYHEGVVSFLFSR